jgi:hypothetical protein
MMDRLDERVQVIKDLLEGCEVIVYCPRQRVPEQRISKGVSICRGNSASFEDIAEYGEERGL